MNWKYSVIYKDLAVIYEGKSFIEQAPGASSIKLEGCAVYWSSIATK